MENTKQTTTAKTLPPSSSYTALIMSEKTTIRPVAPNSLDIVLDLLEEEDEEEDTVMEISLEDANIIWQDYVSQK